ncbi:MAG TPA: D-alanine--D-alanine ligase, partial [Ignavibacteriaceae bacterium]
MKKRHIKVAIVYNESAPEMYEKPAKRSTNSGVSIPFSELEDLTPIEEYEYLVKRLKKLGFNAYSLNILDNIHRMLDDFEKNKPDVIFNFVELYRDNPLLEMNIVGVYELLGIPY